MTKAQYEARSKALMSEAETLISEGELEKFNVKKAEIETLDADFEAAQNAISNLKALQGGVPAPAVLRPGTSLDFEPQDRQDVYGSLEYRLAFMDYAMNGTPIRIKNEDENTLTTDVGSVIPTTVVPRIIEGLEAFGMILPRITRSGFKAGVQIPTSTVRPSASWVNEGAGSSKQKKTTSYITFAGYKLRCEISMSMEVSVSALPIFEATFVKQVSEAMAKAIEAKIVSTNDPDNGGVGAPKGILAETPNDGQALSTKECDYQALCDAEAALPQQYESGAVWCMTKKTFISFVGMIDANKQPIARVDHGIGGKPERYLLGRPVVLCDYLDTYSSTLAAGKTFAFIFNFADYVLNTKYDMGIQRKQDWDTEDLLTKAVMNCDGKVVDKGSLVVLKKKA